MGLEPSELSLMNIGSGEDLISFSQVQEMKKVLDSSSEVPVAISVHPVSVRTHHTDNYTDDCSKTSNTPEDEHGGLKKIIESCSQRVPHSTGPFIFEELSEST